ncbi:MAG: hypothetical protein AAF298_04230 [Cyanobacteria bacterium P01_A01_bin.40]
MSDLFLEQAESENNYTPQQRANFLPLLTTIKRKALLIAAVTGLTTLYAAYIDSKHNPVLKYSGDFQLLVEPLTSTARSTDPIALANNQSGSTRLFEIDYPSMLRVLTSENILDNVVEEVQIDYPEFNLEQLTKNLTVERVGGKNKLDASKILAINYTDKDPKLVELVLEETSREYLDYGLNSRRQGVGKGLQFIERQLPELNRKVTNNRNQIQDLQEKYQIIGADAKGESLLNAVREIELQQSETQKEIEEQTRIVNNLQSRLKISIDEAFAISTLRENPNYQSLITQLNEKESESAVASATFNADSPQMLNLQEERQKILDLLNFETKQILEDSEVSTRVNRFLVLNSEDSILLSLVKDLVTAANELEVLDTRSATLAKNLNAYQTQAQQYPEISRRYQELQQELNIAERTREQLLVQQDRLQIEASQTETPWSIVSKPQVLQDNSGNPKPLPTNSPDRKSKGIIAGLLFGTILAILWEKMEDVFYSTEDVLTAADSAILLAEIPYNQSFNSLQEKINDSNSIFNLKPRNYKDFDFSFAFDRLYANLYFRFRQTNLRSIVVCSPAEGDGKSTVAMGLAQAIATQGKKVLVVGINSFSDRLPENLNTVNQVRENLFISIVSQAAINSSAQREKLMSQFKSDYDYVIYDTPPLLESMTANFLSNNTDGILMVTAIGKTKRSRFIKTIEQIEAFKLPLLGIVTNQNKSIKLDFTSSVDLSKLGTRKLLKAATDSSSLSLKK